jgi:hypothetical protein
MCRRATKQVLNQQHSSNPYRPYAVTVLFVVCNVDQ